MELHDGDCDYLCGATSGALLRLPPSHAGRSDDGRGQGLSLSDGTIGCTSGWAPVTAGAQRYVLLALSLSLKIAQQWLVANLRRNRRATWTARARWLIWFFTADGSSAMVHPCSDT